MDFSQSSSAVPSPLGLFLLPWHETANDMSSTIPCLPSQLWPDEARNVRQRSHCKVCFPSHKTLELLSLLLTSACPRTLADGECKDETTIQNEVQIPRVSSQPYTPTILIKSTTRDKVHIKSKLDLQRAWPPRLYNVKATTVGENLTITTMILES